MAGKPAISTGTLLAPVDDAPVALTRAQALTSTASFLGLPDPDSPAQRTFHQALANRAIGVTKVYQYLREFGFHVRWGHDVPEVPGTRLHLAVTHPQGVKVAVMFRSTRTAGGTWSAEVEKRLTDAGWHVLILESAVVVQTPQEAVQDFLTLLSHLGQLELSADSQPGKAPGRAAAAPLDDWPEPEPVAALPRLPRPAPRRRRRLRPVLLGIALAGVLAGAVVTLLPGEAPVEGWRGGVSFQAKVDALEITPEGHASLKLSTGHKAFVPAHAVQQNTELLHQMIVAWRQGKPLTVFTTSKQHAKHGRQVGIKSVGGGS